MPGALLGRDVFQVELWQTFSHTPRRLVGLAVFVAVEMGRELVDAKKEARDEHCRQRLAVAVARAHLGV